jgi:hypothetical protein
LDESTVGYGNAEAVVEALDRLTRATRDHAMITALAGLEGYATGKIGAQLALALRDGDEARVAQLRSQLAPLLR